MKMKQKAFAVILVLFAAGFIGCDSDSGGGSPKSEQFTESFQAEYQTVSISALQVSTINGQIDITGQAGEEIQLSGIKRADNEEDLEKVDLQVTRENNKIIFNVVHETEQSGLAMDLYLVVPPDIIVEKIDSVNGPVDVSGMDLLYDVRTTNGLILVDIPETDGDINLVSVNGKIDVFISTALNVTIDMSSVNGEIDLYGVSLDLTINMPKHLTGDLGAGGDLISISTVNGSIGLQKL